MKLPYRGILSVLGLLAAVLLLPQSRLWAQSSSSGGSYPSSGSSYYATYIQSAPAANLQISGYLNFQVPISRAGHSFAFKYKMSASGVELSGSTGVMGLATAVLTAGGSPSPIYLAVVAPPPTTPFNPADFWLVDVNGHPGCARFHSRVDAMSKMGVSTAIKGYERDRKSVV